MAYLYLDTSFGQLSGLMDEDFKPIEWVTNPESKSSQFLHRQVHELLMRHQYLLKEIKGLIYCSGPGSYTGMRQTLSFAQVLKLESIPCASFYHFEVPKLLGCQEGLFVANAFKGETFIYQWSQHEEQKRLIKTDSKELVLKGYQQRKFSIDGEFESTQTMLKEQAQKFFPQILKENRQKDLYYYRDLEVEFKVTVGE